MSGVDTEAARRIRDEYEGTTLSRRRLDHYIMTGYGVASRRKWFYVFLIENHCSILPGCNRL
jgi:hypothetical protein